jgi:hypothetical protein
MLRRHCQLSTAATINTKDRSDRTSLDPAGRGVPKNIRQFRRRRNTIVRLAPLLDDVKTQFLVCAKTAESPLWVSSDRFATVTQCPLLSR